MNTKIKFRYLRLIGICLSIIILSANVSAQTDWFFVALTSSGNTIFIDKNFARSSKGIIKIWQKNVSPDESYIIALGEWNCAKKSFRLIQSVMYDNSGIAINRSNNSSQWRIVIPDSTGMLLYLNICEDNQNGGLDKQKIETSGASFAQIIRKANLMSEARLNSKVIRQLALGEKLMLTGKKSGIWYEVYDSKIASQKGYLNGNDFKIVKAKTPSKKANRVRKNNGI